MSSEAKCLPCPLCYLVLHFVVGRIYHELVLTPRDARVGAKTDLLKTIGNKIETPNPRVGKKEKGGGEWIEKEKKLNG